MPATLHLRPGHVQPVWTGHPWVFAQAIARIDGTPAAGDLVDVRDPRGHFLGRGFYSPGSAIPVRILTRDESVTVDDALLAQRLADAFSWRKSLLDLPRENTTGYRLVHAEGDALPGLIVDAYADVLCVQYLTIGMKKRASVIQSALIAATGARSVIEVASARHQKLEGFTVTEGVVHGPPVERLNFHENGIELSVVPPGGTKGGGQKTGYYFDQRETRAMVAGLANGKRVLDLFSYVGGFSLAAARAGAAHVTAVDSSALALRTLDEISRANSLADRITAMKGDAMRVMAQLDLDDARFDVVVLDPPKLASGARDLDGALEHYRKLNEAAVRLVAPGGVLVTCSCSQAMGGGEFLRAVAVGGREARRDVRILRMMGQPPDHPVPAAFPEGRYLKVAVARVA